MTAIMVANMAAIKTTKPYNFWTAQPILLKFTRYIYYMILHMLHYYYYNNFVGLHKLKMAAIMAANMAAIKTTKPYNFWTA